MSSSVTFQVDQVNSQSDLAPGTSNDDATAVLRKFTNPSLVGPGWEGLIAAIAAGDQLNWDNALAAFDQLFISTAGGKYLERAAANYGETKPSTVGMTDDVFRALSIIKKNKKLTQEAFLEVLEVFYGPDAVRGVSTSTAAEPFPLVDQDTLVLLLDEKITVTVTFDRTHYTQVAAATALEVSGEINRALSEAGSNGYAIAYSDPTASGTFVRVYSGSRGLSSSVRVLGGSAQRWLQFPTPVFDIADFSTTSWAVTSPMPGVARFTTNSAGFDLSKLRPDDLVCIFGDPSDPFAAAGIQGTFTVTAVDKYYVVASGSPTPTQYFEIAYIDVPTGTYLQSNFTSMMFFRPTKATLYSQQRHVIVTQLGKVELPATTNIVVRGPGSGAYVNVQDAIDLVSLIRSPTGIVTGTTAAAHGMSVGDQVFVDGASPTGAAPPVTAGSPSGAFSGNVANGTTDASMKSMSSASNTVAATEHKIVRTAEGLLMTIGGFTQTAPGSTTAITSPKIFQVTSDTTLGNGGRQIGYQWNDLATHSFTVGARGVGVSVFPDGQVLASGGTLSNVGTDTGALGTWDLFTYTNSPAQNVQQSGTTPVTRAGHGQCTLSDGTALVAGGFGAASAILATAYTFSLSTLTWTSRGSLGTARKYHQLVPVSGGAIAIGGYDTNGLLLNGCERYDQTAHTWSRASSMGYARTDFGVLSLPDGRVLVVGGTGGLATQGSYSDSLSSCEIYDPGTGLWAPLPPMSVARTRPIVAYLPTKNAVIVAGGGSTVVEMLDIATMRWSRSLATLATGLTLSAGGVAATDTFLVVGGLVSGNNTIAHDYVVLPGSNVLRIGGLNRQATISSVPTSSSFTYSVSDNDSQSAYVETASATVTPSRALPSPAGLPGPYTYDTVSGLAVTGITGVLAQDLAPNVSYEIVALATSPDPNPANAFPDEPGYLAINFGFENQVGPIKYLGRFDNTKLVLDASARLKAPIAAGAVVTFLSSNLPFVPDPDANPLTGNFYLTSSAAGRIAAGDALDDIQAEGLQLERSVIYPSDVGLGNQGDPTSGAQKLSDSTMVWGGDSLDDELAALREGD